MILLCLIILFSIFACGLTLPVFESVLGLLLFCPIVAYLIVTFSGVSFTSAYFLALGLEVICLFCFRGGTVNSKRDWVFQEIVPLVLFCMAGVVFYEFCLLWPDFFPLGERLRDFAILNSVLNSPLEAQEPWMAGAELNYYIYWYRFGHFLASLDNLAVWDVYHRLQSFTFALYLTAVFRLFKRQFNFSHLGALFSSGFIVFGSNIAGVGFFLSKSGDWWGPSRVIKGAINEFPSWSFILGDLHPHYLNLGFIPFVILLFLTFFQKVVSGTERYLLFACGLVVVPLWLYNANAWEIPVLAVIVLSLLLLLLLNMQVRKVFAPLKISSIASILKNAQNAIIVAFVVLTAVSLLLSSRNISSGDNTWKLVGGDISRTRLSELMLHWGFPLIVSSVSIVWLETRQKIRLLYLALFTLTLFLSSALPFLLLLFGVNCCRVMRESKSVRDGRRKLKTSEFVAEAIGVAATLLLIIPEIVFFDDAYGGDSERMNTIFKFTAANWFLLHCFAFFLAARVIRDIRCYFSGVSFYVLHALVLVFFSGCFVKNIQIRRIRQFSVMPRVEGLNTVEHAFSGAASAIRFLRSASGGVVLEGQGGAYDYTAHVATLAGKPSFLGWANHVGLLTNKHAEVSRRRELTHAVYRDKNCQVKRKKAADEGIRYLVIGPLENKYYPELKEDSFSCFRKVFEKGKYKIFLVGQ